MPPSREETLAALRERMAAIESARPAGGSPSAASAADEGGRRRAIRGDVPAGHGPAASDGVESEDESAFKKVQRLCSAREQASLPLEARLVRDGFSEAAASAAVARAVRCGLVDDSRYAEVLVRSRIRAGRGLCGIGREVERLGIDPSSVQPYAEALSCGDDWELERALAALDAKPPRAKNLREAAYRRLAQKGFSTSVAASAARRWSESAQGHGRR